MLQLSVSSVLIVFFVYFLLFHFISSHLICFLFSSYSGSVAPYLIGWTLYQGTTLMSLVNWTGLVVNGLVAFLLPMFLVIKSMEKRHLVPEETSHKESERLIELTSSNRSQSTDVENVSTPYSTFSNLTAKNSTSAENYAPNVYHSSNREDTTTPSSLSDTSPLRTTPVPLPIHDDSSVEPLPLWLEPYRYPIVLFMIVCFGVIIGGTILLDIVFGISPG